MFAWLYIAVPIADKIGWKGEWIKRIMNYMYKFYTSHAYIVHFIFMVQCNFMKFVSIWQYFFPFLLHSLLDQL